MATSTTEKNVTFYGRLSFPTLTAKEAYDRSQKGKYPAADVASASPDFTLLVEQAMLDKVRDHVVNVAMPYWVKRNKDGEKRDELTKKEADDLIAQINGADFAGHMNTPFKPVHEKTAPLAPECVAAIKCIGNKGQDIEVKAIVHGGDELVLDDGTRVDFPAVIPIGESKHSLYPGCYVAVTVNLYAYRNGKIPGFSAGVSVAVFRAEGDRFGGGVSIDENEIFMD